MITLREKIVGMKEKRNSGPECDRIRKEVFEELASNAHWSSSKEMRKARRAINCAIETTSNETMSYYLGHADEIIGSRIW